LPGKLPRIRVWVASSITGEIPIKLFDSFVGLFVLAVTSAEIRAFAAYF
jgi:hypothetical protein